MEKQIMLTPIGYAQVSKEGFSLVIHEEFLPALKTLDGFSHLQVLWWGHLHDDHEHRALLEVKQPYRKAPPKMGIFATRAPHRPNPIALSTVEIIHIDANNGIVQVPFIDAVDGTPLLDIKPYHPSCDRVRDITVPSWCAHWPKWYEESADFNWEAEFVTAR